MSLGETSARSRPHSKPKSWHTCIRRPRVFQIAWTASISVFVRDFDSVEVQEGAKVDGNLYVRRFEASYMDVAPIIIGKGADIRSGSVVYGGTSVGDHW